MTERVMAPAITMAIVLAQLGHAVQVAGLVTFFAGIAVGLLFVFADRHGYERPAPPRLVGVLLIVGVVLMIGTWIGQRFGI